MELMYINSTGTVLNLSHYPYEYLSGDVYDYYWEHGSKGFYKRDVEIPIKIGVLADNIEEYNSLMNHLRDVTEYDIATGNTGRLYCRGQYLKCNIRGVKKADFNKGVPYTLVELRAYSSEPFWIEEHVHQFQKIAGDAVVVGLDYPYNYPYDYTVNMTQSNEVVAEFYADCNFRLKVYGPCTNPVVTINDIDRKMLDSLESGEYFLIDTTDKTIKKVLRNGTELNAFNNRQKGSTDSIFTLLRPGKNTVNYSGEFGFDLTVLTARSEPKWR